MRCIDPVLLPGRVAVPWLTVLNCESKGFQYVQTGPVATDAYGCFTLISGPDRSSAGVRSCSAVIQPATRLLDAGF